MYDDLIAEAREPWLKVTALGQKTLKPPIIDRLTDALESTLLRESQLIVELDQVACAIGDHRYMDPPDGGNVSLGEQVKRMRAEVDSFLKLQAALKTVADSRRGTTLENEFC